MLFSWDLSSLKGVEVDLERVKFQQWLTLKILHEVRNPQVGIFLQKI